MVICKSVTRFARNTVDTLMITRELKNLGIDVFFEQERVHSISSDGELLLSILASYAQEESRVVSENCKWRIRKNFKNGIINNQFKIYGYEFKNGKLEIIPEEAEIIKIIFESYLEGSGLITIAKKLNALNIKSKLGTNWSNSTIFDILKNEKYIGDMLLQKSYIVDHLTKKQVKNNGELPQYYVKNSHAAIIDRELFEKVQNEMKRKSRKPIETKKNHIFTGKIKCGICGSNFKHKTANIGSKYAKSVWICNTFNTLGKSYCESKQIPEEILKSKAAEVLKISEFQGDKFKQNIKQILVPKFGTLLFYFVNGDQIETTWQNPSRRESWTEEKRQKARERALNNLTKGESEN